MGSAEQAGLNLSAEMKALEREFGGVAAARDRAIGRQTGTLMVRCARHKLSPAAGRALRTRGAPRKGSEQRVRNGIARPPNVRVQAAVTYTGSVLLLHDGGHSAVDER